MEKLKHEGCLVIAASITGFLLAIGVIGIMMSDKAPKDTAQKLDETTISTTAEQTTTQTDLTTTETTTIEFQTTIDESSSVYVPPILIFGGQPNKYSEEVYYNKGTADESVKLGYFLPPGDYSLQNTLSRPVQYCIYSRKTHKQNGFDEAVDGTAGMLKEHEFIDITIKPDYFLYILSGDSVSLTPKG